jgi:hypothetical protein
MAVCDLCEEGYSYQSLREGYNGCRKSEGFPEFEYSECEEGESLDRPLLLEGA